jgi:PAS domain S-box-containing protein
MFRRFRTAAGILILAAVYFAFGKLGLSLAIVNASASAVWPPSGIALAALILWRRNLWPGVFIGAFLVNITTQGSILMTLGIATGNTLEAVVGAWLIGRYASGRKVLEEARTIFKFVGLAAPSTAISATFGTTSLCLGIPATWSQYGPIWLTWWLGDFVSDLVVAPLLIIWVATPLRRPQSQQPLLECAFLAVALAVVSYVVFGGGGLADINSRSLEYLTIPPLLWAAFRFGRHGAITSAFILSGVAVFQTVSGHGPFVTDNPNQSLLLLQAFMGTITLTAVVLASVVSERKAAERRLQVQHAVSRMLAESPQVEEAIQQTLQILCDTAGWDVAAFWRANQETNEITCVALRSISGPDVSAFETKTKQMHFAPGTGLPGRVWKSGEPEWIAELQKDSNFPRAQPALQSKLQTGIAFPLRLDRETLGIMECFSRDVRQRDEHLLRMLAGIGEQLGQFMAKKNAQEALRSSEELHRTVSQTVADGIITIDEASTILSVNPAVERIFGYTSEEIVGQPLTMLMPERLRKSHRAGIQHYFETGQNKMPWKGVELPGLRKDGVEIPLEISFGISSKAGKTVFAGVIRDITERKRTEEKLRESEERFRTFMNGIPNLAWIANADGQVFWYNDRWYQYTGTTPGEMEEGGWRQRVHDPQRLPEVLERWRASVATGEPFEMVFPLRGADGNFRQFLTRVVPLRDSEGKVEQWFGTNTDVTAQKETEKTLRETEGRLVQANAELERHALDLERIVAERTARLRETVGELEAFSYSVAHDMRAPLRAMQGFAGILQEDESEHLSETGMDYLRRIAASANRLDLLIRDVLSYSQISRGDLRLDPVNVERLLHDILESYPNLQSAKAEIQVEGSIPKVIANTAALTQVISNLLGNAVKFVKPGVRPQVRIHAEEKGEYVRVWFDDNGIGVPKELREKIFEIFQRLNPPSEYDGTGIGLAIVRKALERMHGRVGVESEPAHGSQFWIELKRASPS